MRLVSEKEVFTNSVLRKEIIESMKRGDIFIYPTDTVYGIGCSLENFQNAQKIYTAKQRPINKPFSVIVPSKEWIYKNCEISEENKSFLENLLPGPYTAVLPLKKGIKFEANKSNGIGVRIPKHPIAELVKEAGILLITTSVNIAGEKHAKSVQEIPDEIKQIADWIIDAGELGGSPSRVFDMTGELTVKRY